MEATTVAQVIQDEASETTASTLLTMSKNTWAMSDTMTAERDNQDLVGTGWPTPRSMMPPQMVHTVVIMMAIFMFVHRRSKQQWTKTARTEKLQRLKGQEEVLRYKILMKKVEHERDFVKRKLKYLQVDIDILEQQVHDLQSQRHRLYEILDISNRSAMLSTLQDNTLSAIVDNVICPADVDDDTNGVKIELDSEGANGRRDKSIVLLTRSVAFLQSKKQDNDKNDAITDDDEDDVSVSSRSTVVTEPASPSSTVKTTVKNLNAV